MIQARKKHPAFGWGGFRWIETDLQIAAFWREYQEERLLILNNLSRTPQGFQLPLPAGEHYTDLLSGQMFVSSSEGYLEIQLQPFGYRWLKRQPGSGAE
jgi:maltose alpha-D-glucosyltransferase/alpha-amylase